MSSLIETGSNGLIWASIFGGFLVPIYLVVWWLINLRTSKYNRWLESMFALLFYFSFYGFIVAGATLTVTHVINYVLRQA